MRLTFTLAFVLLFSICFSQAGVLDTTFGQSGQARVGPMSVTGGIVLQPDGKILVAGAGQNSTSFLFRLNPDGSLDNSFGNGGRVQTSFAETITITGIGLLPDGKIILSKDNTSGG